ncbi:MAG: TolC family protein, partial [Treponema sp.]|nr:TolC family protein [Treponema sp.]
MRGNGWPGSGPGSRVWPAALLLIAIPLLGGGAFLGAQTEGARGEGEGPPRMRLTVEEAVDLALKNNLSLQAGAITLDTKKRASDLVWNQFLPDLAVRGTLARQNKAATQSGTVPVVPYGPTQDLYNYLSQSKEPGIPIPGGTLYNYMMPYSATLPQWHLQGNFSATLTLSAALFAGIDAIKTDY